MELYSQILDNGGPAVGTIFRHVRDHPDKGCIFHCTGTLRFHLLHQKLNEILSQRERTERVLSLPYC